MGAYQQGAEATQNRWQAMPRTLSFVLNGDAVLLIKRAPHRRVFPNQYNGLGGHIKRDEDPASGAIREIKEESGLNVHSLRLRSVHNIDAGQQTGILLFVYTAISDSRVIERHSLEGELEWVEQGRLNELNLVEDLLQLLPRILQMSDDQPPMHVHVSYDESDRIKLRFRGNS